MRNRDETTSALVLVVDDEELARLFVREALEHAGFEVCEASNSLRVCGRILL
jgi:CheY-like chemotaxis protein